MSSDDVAEHLQELAGWMASIANEPNRYNETKMLMKTADMLKRLQRSNALSTSLANNMQREMEDMDDRIAELEKRNAKYKTALDKIEALNEVFKELLNGET